MEEETIVDKYAIYEKECNKIVLSISNAIAKSRSVEIVENMLHVKRIGYGKPVESNIVRRRMTVKIVC